ncbi:MAG: hypothetical protein A2583_07695 [Bdellovibrionales bacterium RIFOXYD1_FULL_53_11]|nr:MAG: hypothetical protein A2583_07695 [Bdellovibrionales bacterium RIFOXYD1_FULL_53_11]
MDQTMNLDLHHNKSRLAYYQQRKTELDASNASKRSTRNSARGMVEKWIEIYVERVRKLENQIARAGLKTGIGQTVLKQKASGK